MIRRGTHKFIHTPTDPDLLFDVATDPEEQRNLASNRDHAARVEEFRREVGERWNIAALHREVLESQRRRLFVVGSLRRGRQTAWDWQPPRDASQMYVRNSIPLEELEAMSRFPKWERPSP